MSDPRSYNSMLSFNRAQQHYDNMSPEDVGGNVEAGEEEDAAEDDAGDRWCSEYQRISLVNIGPQ